MKKLALTLALVGTLGCGFAVAWTRSDDRRTTAVVEAGELRKKLTVQAVIAAQGGVAEVRPRMDGVVLRVLVSEGDRVHAGDLLAELDSDELRANVARSEAEVRSLAAAARAVSNGARDEERAAFEAEVAAARAQLEQAKDRAKRSALLHLEGAEAEASAEDAARAEEIARAQLARAEARLNQARVGGSHNDVQVARERLAAATASSQAAHIVFARSRLVSPIDGVILSRHIDPGDTVGLARIDAPPAFEIADVARKEVRLEAEEHEGALLEVGQCITVQLPGGLTTVGQGRITRVGARMQVRTIGADDARVRAESKVRVAWAEWNPKPGHNLAVGQRVEAVVQLPSRQVAARLPRQAITVHDGRAWVRLPSALGGSKQSVALGQSDDQYVEVLGLAAGTAVLLTR